MKTKKTAKVAKPDPKAPMAKAKDWHIEMPFVHSSITYGPGEALPKMTEAQAIGYESMGRITRVNLQRDVEVVVGTAAPKQSEDYLAGNDMQILRRLRTFPVDEAKMKSILSAARAQTRSIMLIEALALAAKEPVK